MTCGRACARKNWIVWQPSRLLTTRKALEAEKQKTVKDKNAKIDPKVKEELEQAEQAAREQYEAELQSQQLAREEEQAQNNRTWVPKD